MSSVTRVLRRVLPYKTRQRIVGRYLQLLAQLHRPLVKPGSSDPYHAVLPEFIEQTKSVDDASILEIGARNVTGESNRQHFNHCQAYVGFDIIEGEGVDVVGDAHKLSDHFEPAQFDFVLSVSVFEHLLFPWKAVMEIHRVLAPGGLVYLSTHPAWPAHELPWDFWRFPQGGFHALFNRQTGFEILTLNEGLPALMYSLVDDDATAHHYLHPVNQGVALIAKKVGPCDETDLRWDIAVGDVLDTMYPKPASHPVQ